MTKLSAAILACGLALAPAAGGPGAAAQGIACSAASTERVEVPFATGSSRLGADAQAAVADAAARARAQNLRVCVFGKASKLGNADANARLAQARARAVADALAARGMPRNAIEIGSQGEGFGDGLFGGSDNNAQSDRSAEIVFLTQQQQGVR